VREVVRKPVGAETPENFVMPEPINANAKALQEFM